MRVYQGMTFANMVGRLLEDFSTAARPVDVGQWQGLDIKGDPNKVTWELREAVLAMQMPDDIESAQCEYQPNLPWAEDHFNERVSGRPLNPPPSQAWWPFAQNGHSEHLRGGEFSHTYPERFWPRHAGHSAEECGVRRYHREKVDSSPWMVTCPAGPHTGVRFAYGDLGNVVDRLRKSLHTRQAYLPVWFPEDTGAPDSERVPCTLGYHFLVRDSLVHVTYHIRACDFMRHFRDDVYMAVRLGQWVRDRVGTVHPGLGMGELTMHIGSFHVFTGDMPMIAHLRKEARINEARRLWEALG